MLAFLEFVAIVIAGGITLSAALSWMKQKHPRWRDCAAFVVAGGAAYAASFALDMFIGAYVRVYSFSPFTIPVFTWSGIAVALHRFARSASVTRRWMILPYLAIGGIAMMTGFLGPHKYNIAVGAPLVLFALFSFLSSKD